MRKLPFIKFLTQLMLLVMLAITLHGVAESAHALQGCSAVPNASAYIHHPPCANDHCPCSTPSSEHKDSDGCDSCVNCICHAPLPMQQLALHYSPVVRDLIFSEPYQFLPEVFLSKFIPPQNQA
ncbi:hypothetical protein FY034_02010 [Trichlorobacter lovleyi]|nr:hypothetical protein FY034_02010 [Trichlorobacter lovleyi]